MQVDENGCKYILFWIDAYFTEHLLAAEIDEKGRSYWQRPYFLGEKTKNTRKKLGYKFIYRINTSKEGYEAHYEASRIQTFISKFKDRQFRKLNKKLKEIEDKIEKLTDQISQ